MSGSVTFVVDPTIEEQIMASSWLRELLDALAAGVAAEARRLAHKLTEHMANSIAYEVGFDQSAMHGTLIARVFATDFKAAWHEFGTRKMHPHPFLFPALMRELPGASITGGSLRPEYR